MKKLLLLAQATVALAACSQNDVADPAQSDDPTTTSTAAPAPAEPETATSSPEAVSKNADDERAEQAPLRAEIPDRFHGKYAESQAQCDNPSHGLFTVGAKAIDFFESTGEVRNVRADGPYAAVTVFEQYGDSPGNTYAFYMRILPNGELRYRYDDNDRFTWVRCP